MEQEKNEKVLAMYQAVCALVEEGHDIHKVKVADITQKAGIGKGTAYEYFRSKEELVGKALRYDFLMQFQVLEEQVRKQENLHSAMESCFAWLDETADRRRLAMQFFRKAGYFPGDSEKVCEGEIRLEMIRGILGFMIQLGREEGTICRDIPENMAMLQLFAQFVGFFAYRELDKCAAPEEIIKTKDFLYDTMVRGLGSV